MTHFPGEMGERKGEGRIISHWHTHSLSNWAIWLAYLKAANSVLYPSFFYRKYFIFYSYVFQCRTKHFHIIIYKNTHPLGSLISILWKPGYEDSSYKEFWFSLFSFQLSPTELSRYHWFEKELNKRACDRADEVALGLLNEHSASVS